MLHDCLVVTEWRVEIVALYLCIKIAQDICEFLLDESVYSAVLKLLRRVIGLDLGLKELLVSASILFVTQII